MNTDITLKESFKFLKLTSTNKGDLSELTFITPFLITPLTAFLKQTTLNKEKYKLIPSKSEQVYFYLNTIKFPNCISINEFNNMSELKTYFPLFSFTKKDIQSEKLLNKFIECLDYFANILIHKELIYQPIDELIDNIVEHSDTQSCYINAQIYKDNKNNKDENKNETKEYLALSIVDTGKSIPNSYRDAGFDLETDSEAFEYILQGISSTKDPNRGYGLNTNINIISSALKGSITIISGKTVLHKNQKEKPTIYKLEEHNLGFNGTIINIIFAIPKTKMNINPYDYIGKKQTYTI